MKIEVQTKEMKKPDYSASSPCHARPHNQHIPRPSIATMRSVLERHLILVAKNGKHPSEGGFRRPFITQLNDLTDVPGKAVRGDIPRSPDVLRFIPHQGVCDEGTDAECEGDDSSCEVGDV